MGCRDFKLGMHPEVRDSREEPKSNQARKNEKIFNSIKPPNENEKERGLKKKIPKETIKQE